jgi:serine/threonine-protein kinase RsbW
MESTLRVLAELPNLAVIRHFVEETAMALKADRDAIDDMIQAVDESATNIIVHGYRGRTGNIEIEVTQEGYVLVVRLRDQAPLFDPTRAPPPDLTLPLERRRLGGLGIHLTRQFSDSMTYRITSEGGNELALRKKVKGEGNK